MRLSAPWSLLVLGALSVAHAQGVQNHFQSAYPNFEGGEAAPLAISNDGTTLFALNQADHRLELYTADANGLLLDYAGDVFTGLEPSAIALDPNDNTTVFVSNWVSDSVAVVDVPSRTVRTVLQVGDEPREMVVANGKLYVAVARVEDPDPAVAVAATSGSAPGAGVMRRPFIENAVSVFDLASLTTTPTTVIPIGSVQPRSLVTDGTVVYVVPEVSGNETTIIDLASLASVSAIPGFPGPILQHVEDNTGPFGCATCPPIFPGSWNPLFFLLDFIAYPGLNGSVLGWRSPAVGRIVTEAEVLPFFPTVTDIFPDDDVFVIDTATDTVTATVKHVGTTLLDAALHPTSNELWVAALDANNRVRMEFNLQGNSHTNLVTRVSTTSNTVTGTTPFDGIATPSKRAMPIDIAFANGTFGVRSHVAALGSDTVVVLDGAGGFVQDLATGSMPRGLVVDTNPDVLYVLCRGDMSIEAYSIPTYGQLGSTSLAYDPEPAFVRDGRKTMYGAEGGRGDGTASCASCHTDGEWDGLVWDLGNSMGGLSNAYPDMHTSQTGNIFPQQGTPLAQDPLPAALHPFGTLQDDNLVPGQLKNHTVHPMKGPMTTQLLKGMGGSGSLGQSKSDEPFHWRGDRRFLNQFQPAFVGLQNGSGVTDAEMQTFVGFLKNMVVAPNPYQPRDREYRDYTVSNGGTSTSFFTGQGRLDFGVDSPGLPYTGNLTCVDCHEGSFSSASLDFTGGQLGVNNDLSFQLFNPAPLRKVYEKEFKAITGFGTGHEGSKEGIKGFVDQIVGTNLVFPYPGSANPQQTRDGVTEFTRAWDSGIHPGVGMQLTIDSSNVFNANITALWATMEQIALDNAAALIAKGRLNVPGSGIFDVGAMYESSTGTYLFDSGVGNVPTGTVRALLFGSSSTLTFTVVPGGLERRLGIDRDEDGLFDRQEPAAMTSVVNPDSDADGFSDGREAPLGIATNSAAQPSDSTTPLLALFPVRDVWIDAAMLVIGADEPVTLTVSVAPTAGGTAQTFASSGIATRHELSLSGLPPATPLTATVTGTDAAGNSTTNTVSFTTEIPHVHVQNLDLKVDASGVVKATAIIRDHTETPVANMTVRGILMNWRLVAGLPVVGTFTTGGVQAIPITMTTNASGVASIVVNTGGAIPTGDQVTWAVTFLGSTNPAAPDYAGVLFDATTPGPFGYPSQFYDESRNDMSFVTRTAP